MEMHLKDVHVEIIPHNTNDSHTALESLLRSLSAYSSHYEGHCPTENMGRMESPSTPILAVDLRV